MFDFAEMILEGRDLASAVEIRKMAEVSKTTKIMSVTSSFS